MMHVTADTQGLRKVLEIASRVSTKHLTLPVLQCVLLKVVGSTLTISATNLEIGVVGSLSVEVGGDGEVAVPTQTLLQTINLNTQKHTTLSLEGEVLHVETKTSKTAIKSVSTEEFPHIPQVTENTQSINGVLFAQGIKTTVFAASQSSIKPELGCVYVFQKKEHTLTFTTTDSFRLIEKTAPQHGFILQDSLLIPYKNALEIARVAELAEDVVMFSTNENQCALTVGNIYITSRLTNGSFPDYEQIIPKEYVTHSTVLTSDFLHALKKTNIFLNKFMQLTVVVDTESLTLSAQSGEVGTTTESLHAATEGDAITLNFNQRYIAEVLPHITDDSITLHFAGVGRPMVIESVHDKSMRYLVMPMNK
ncbi:DNA polymerase III subunit beta [Candidatus Kaiserbacteria bacterium]|nr:DNA polymerase III subunit beta [Candidatus Kaiserbacteria bacterium]